MGILKWVGYVMASLITIIVGICTVVVLTTLSTIGGFIALVIGVVIFVACGYKELCENKATNKDK